MAPTVPRPGEKQAGQPPPLPPQVLSHRGEAGGGGPGPALPSRGFLSVGGCEGRAWGTRPGGAEAAAGWSPHSEGVGQVRGDLR